MLPIIERNGSIHIRKRIQHICITRGKFINYKIKKKKKKKLSELIREKILLLVYQVFRSISYADGTDNNLVNKCLDNTFQIWMSLFLSAL